MAESERTRARLLAMAPTADTFVGVDSDGCVFDTMEAKQKKCFHPLIIEHWHLEPIAQAVRETAEFVALYSRWRGTNRFPALKLVFELLAERPDVREAGVALPDTAALERFIGPGVALGNPALAQLAETTGDPALVSLLTWSRAVNAAIAEKVGAVPPFAGAREALERIGRNSDAICVSQTPTEALEREWAAHGLRGCVREIAGQELGSKAEHLAMAAGGKYDAEKILMIGDAFGDLEAARANGALFFPINPGREESSWSRFCQEAYELFLTGRYAGGYESELLREFEALLPTDPPWQRGSEP